MTIHEAHNGGITRMHNRFEQLTGRQIMLDPHKMFHWEKWLVINKFTEADLEVVVQFLKNEIQHGRNFVQALWFRNLIEDTDKFQEYLNDARLKVRPKIKDQKASVMDRPPYTAKPERVKFYLEQMRKVVG